MKLAEQVDGQSIPLGELTTDPPPLPEVVRLRVYVVFALKTALTLMFPDRVTDGHVAFVPLVLQLPPQPPNVEFADGVDEKDTTVPALN